MATNWLDTLSRPLTVVLILLVCKEIQLFRVASDMPFESGSGGVWNAIMVEFDQAESRELVLLLEDSLAALRAEARRTEDHAYKEWLCQKRQLLERMLEHCLQTPILHR